MLAECSGVPSSPRPPPLGPSAEGRSCAQARRRRCEAESGVTGVRTRETRRASPAACRSSWDLLFRNHDVNLVVFGASRPPLGHHGVLWLKATRRLRGEDVHLLTSQIKKLGLIMWHNFKKDWTNGGAPPGGTFHLNDHF